MDMTVPELHVCEWEERRARKGVPTLHIMTANFPGHSPVIPKVVGTYVSLHTA